MKGNSITLKYYYNSTDLGTPTQTITLDKLNKFTKTVNNQIITYYYYELNATGIHKINICDMAGNEINFGGRNYYEIYLVNSILYQINNQEPIPNYITNGEVVLTLLDKINNYQLYKLNSIITVTKNGQPYTIESQNTGEYKFTESGTYVITVTGTNEKNMATPEISHTIEFTIVNPNVAYSSYTISSSKGFTVVSVNKKLDNSENSRDNYLTGYKGNNNLLIDCDDQGSGFYTITLSKYLDSIKKTVNFSFNVWLNNNTDSTIIIPSIPFGTSTSDTIILKYNPANIYSNVGDCYITINGHVIETINKDSVSETKTYQINTKGDYWIRIESANGQLLASYKLTKTDPLNATAKIIIIIAVISVIALVVMFIILRRKTRFR